MNVAQARCHNVTAEYMAGKQELWRTSGRHNMAGLELLRQPSHPSGPLGRYRPLQLDPPNNLMLQINTPFNTTCFSKACFLLYSSPETSIDFQELRWDWPFHFRTQESYDPLKYQLRSHTTHSCLCFE